MDYVRKKRREYKKLDKALHRRNGKTLGKRQAEY